ncbi:MAG: hypothetical protein WCD70_08495 [Alphaproteobacteria bacterium]
MTPRNVDEVFRLSSSVRNGFVHALPFDPLELVATPNNRPRLIISYDHNKFTRVDLGIPRIETLCTHMNITVIPGVGKAPVCASFGAACAIEDFKDGAFQRVNPHLAHEDATIFGPLKNWSPWKIITSPNFKYGVKGQVIDESWRHGDSFISIELKNDWQIRGALKTIEQWRASPPKYALYGPLGKNCKDFVNAVIAGAGIKRPPWYKVFSWPALDSEIISFMCGGKLRTTDEGWLLQPRAVTELMGAVALERGSCRKSTPTAPPLQP